MRSAMTRSTMRIVGFVLSILHTAFLMSPSGRLAKGQDRVPISALRAYLHDRAELLGTEGRLLLCPGLVAPTADSSLLARELGRTVVLISDCSSAQGRSEQDVPGDALLIRRSMLAGDTLILIGGGFRRGVANSGPTEFSAWGERAALLRVGVDDAWFVVSVTLTGVERAMNRRPPHSPAATDSTKALVSLPVVDPDP